MNDGNAYLRELLHVNIVPYSHQNEKNLIGKVPSSKLILLGEDDIDDEELLKELFSTVDDSFELTFINNGRHVFAQKPTNTQHKYEIDHHYDVVDKVELNFHC